MTSKGFHVKHLSERQRQIGKQAWRKNFLPYEFTFGPASPEKAHSTSSYLTLYGKHNLEEVRKLTRGMFLPTEADWVRPMAHKEERGHACLKASSQNSVERINSLTIFIVSLVWSVEALCSHDT